MNTRKKCLKYLGNTKQSKINLSPVINAVLLYIFENKLESGPDQRRMEHYYYNYKHWQTCSKSVIVSHAQCPIIQVWPSGRITLIGDVTPGQETGARNFCFLPCLSNNMRIRGHNFLTQIFLTGSCCTKNILRHVGNANEDLQDEQT